MNIKLLNDLATVPTQGTDGAAGYDLYAAIDTPLTIPTHECRKVSTGIAILLPPNIFGAVFSRSGLSTNEGLRLANSVGVIDPDYRGEILVPLYNDSSEEQTIQPNERIAQIIFIPFRRMTFNEVDELTDTPRGSGGFGSTDAQKLTSYDGEDRTFTEVTLPNGRVIKRPIPRSQRQKVTTKE